LTLLIPGKYEVNPDLDPIELRPSTLESMSYCPARQRYQDHPLYDPTPSEAMQFGSLQHALIFPNFTPEVQEHGMAIRYTTDEILNTWLAVAEVDKLDLAEVTSKQTLRTLVLEARDLYNAWTVDVWPHLREYITLAVEVRLRMSLGALRSGREVFLSGTPDHVRVGDLDDWKTGSSHYDQGKADSRPQGQYYAILAEAEYGMQFDTMTYWSANRKKGAWVPITQVMTNRSRAAARAAAMEWAGMIEADYYPPTPSAPTGKNGRGWWCSAKYCNAWEVCDFKGIIADGVDLNAKRDKGWPA
jgi:hypothetical protein